MGLKNFIEINRRIIATYNSCDMKAFSRLIDDLLEQSNAEKYFTKKWYVWNVIRPKDYYKCMAEYVINCITKVLNPPKEDMDLFNHISPDSDEALRHYNEHYMSRADYIIKMVLETTKDAEIRKSFIWKIMKKVPLLTIDTIQYASPEKIHSLLTGNKDIVSDDYMRPVIKVITEYREQLKVYEVITEDNI